MSESILDYWRNFTPEAEDIYIEAFSGVETFIDLKHLLLQGAKDFYDFTSPSNGVLDAVPVQRGWLLEPVHTAEPLFGKIVDGWTPYGFTYQSYYRYLGADCFNYILTNGMQESRVGKIIVNVVPTYDVKVKIYNRGIDRFYFSTEVTEPSGVPASVAKSFYWYVDTYKVVFNETRQRDEVWPVRKLLSSTAFQYTYYRGWSYRLKADSLSSMFDRNNSFKGYWKDTDSIFEGKDELGKLALVIRFYSEAGRYGPNTSKYHEIEYTFKDFGTKWWTSGNVQ